MGWQRYFLNYAFNTGEHKMLREIDSEGEAIKYIDEHIKPAGPSTALNEMLKLFVTSEHEKPIKAIKDHLRSVANTIYGTSVLDGAREAFSEAIDTNIVHVPCLNMWDYSQWTLKENIEVTEEELF